jgi:T-complex protein 1 subunit alpha
VDAGVLGIRRVGKNEIRKIAKASGGKVVTTLATPEGEEVFDPKNLGECKEVIEKAIGDNDFIFFSEFKNTNVASIIVRGANELMCEEIERSLHDSLCVIKRTLETGFVVPGGGACEIALNIKLEDFAKTLGNKE